MESFILQMPMEHFPGAGMDVRCSGPTQVLVKQEEGSIQGPEREREDSATSGLRGKARKIFAGIGG